MRAIIITEQRMQEMLQRFTDTIKLETFLVGRQNSLEEYARHVHYYVHKFVDAICDDKPWCPDYTKPNPIREKDE